MRIDPRKQWYIDHGICPLCGHEDAEPGKQLCFECGERNRQICAERYRRDPKANIRAVTEARKRRREARYAAGLCTECGKRPHLEGVKMCGICREKHRRQDRARSEREGRLPQILRGDGTYCYRCCKPVCSGEKVCTKCRGKMQAGAAAARAAVDLKGHIWARLDHANVLEQSAGSRKRKGLKA